MDDERLAEYRRHQVGFVLQSFNLIPTMTARGNVELPLVFAGVAPAERGATLMQRVAQELGRNGEPVIRQRLAQAYILEEVGRMMSIRAKQLRASGSSLPGEGNLAKLLMSRVLRLGRDLGPEIIGPYAGILGGDTPGGGALQEATIWAPGPSIYGGSDEIQKNIVGERVLGLPKEPGPDKNTPFRQLLVGTQP